MGVCVCGEGVGGGGGVVEGLICNFRRSCLLEIVSAGKSKILKVNRK